ncbi:putative thioredoxin reductase, partial [Aspergillus nomiae NRRL 13137]
LLGPSPAMMFTCNWTALLCTLLSILSVCIADVPETSHDVIIIGGGPSGLSAASGLSRVLRKSVLFDSGEYRNNPTRHMHDVIGNDHVVPAEFRKTAREQIAFYNSTTFIDEKVTKLEKVGDNIFQATFGDQQFTARKVILASGMKDNLPDVPGLEDGFGKGIYWCPWCDGFEHRNQSMGVLGNLSDAYGAVRELHPTLNKDIRIYANGTNTTEQIAILDEKHPNWRKVFQTYNVTVNNKPILNITRIQDGGVVYDPATRREFDKFQIYFVDNSFEVRGAFLTNYDTSQRSDLPAQLGVEMLGSKMNTLRKGLRTSVPGVWGVGDANSDNSTNVPHAMSSGKSAAVYCHVEMAQEELDRDAGLEKRETEFDEASFHEATEQQMGSEIHDLYKRLSRR